jgi:hypothetical protein
LWWEGVICGDAAQGGAEAWPEAAIRSAE